jgi:hypothetical protein
MNLPRSVVGLPGNLLDHAATYSGSAKIQFTPLEKMSREIPNHPDRSTSALHHGAADGWLRAWLRSTGRVAPR